MQRGRVHLTKEKFHLFLVFCNEIEKKKDFVSLLRLDQPVLARLGIHPPHRGIEYQWK